MHMVVNTWYHNGLRHIAAMHHDSLYPWQHMHSQVAPDPVQVQVNMTGENLRCMLRNHKAIVYSFTTQDGQSKM